MRVPDIIMKKRDGHVLSPEEIRYMIGGMLSQDVPDYQMSAFCMAIFFQGMTPEETTALTTAMADSGRRADLSAIRGIKVDKHSTGGVGDTTTLVLVPMVAAAGVPVAKMSGRGLGHTGGTLDKLESIPGFRVSLSEREFVDQVNRIGLAIVGQTEDIAPADKRLYALRDVTATVESIPLIASSIMSKKLATGADAIVLDVKAGTGAFMHELDRARRLARAMVDIGRLAGRRMAAVISDMNQPLGQAIGNSLEVIEAIDTLSGRSAGRLLQLCLELGAHMVVLGGAARDTAQARAVLSGLVESGAALAKLREMVKAQGGDATCVDDPSRIGAAPLSEQITAPTDGYVSRVDALTLGRAAAAMGAGRQRKTDSVDLHCGLKVLVSVGDRIEAGQPVATLYAGSQPRLREGTAQAGPAFAYSDAPCSAPPLVYEIIER
ncbi:MAG TPA: pyrimidine-nucleoside phosphorylase [Firmicutes bacterium]|nr:pyrimidine-nucleoside phosphorylase [Bacillota bacterium]